MKTRGRPRGTTKIAVYTERVTVMVSPEQAKMLYRGAVDEGISIAEYVRRMIDERKVSK